MSNGTRLCFIGLAMLVLMLALAPSMQPDPFNDARGNAVLFGVAFGFALIAIAPWEKSK